MKLVAVGVLIVVCVVPSFFVWILLAERTNRQDEAKVEITSKWGESQVIAGPILSLPYRKSYLDSQGTRQETTGVLNMLPEKLQYMATLDPEVRSRGIFDAVVYKAHVEGKGTFAMPDFSHTSITAGDIEWDKAYVSVGISDTRGILAEIPLAWAGATVPFKSGAKNASFGERGIHAFVPINLSKKSFDFAYAFDLRGSEDLQFLPLGNETIVDIKSGWNSPSFIGAYLPAERTLDNGFSAHWSVSSFGRSYPQQWLDEEASMASPAVSIFGVSLIQGIDFYKKVERTVKYAVMFIAITFLAFFLFEVLGKLNIHPFQYLLVGLALALFYLLLLSLSERIGFLPAYVISTAATVGLITTYSAKVLGARGKALIVAALLALLYSYLYVIVQLEDLALLSGAVLLFVLLALTMYLTRNIDWYRLDSGEVGSR